MPTIADRPPNSLPSRSAQGMRPRASAAGATRRANRCARAVGWLTWINAAGVLALLILLCVISENWWFSAALTYLPRAPYLAPGLGLLAASLVVRRNLAWVNLVAVVIVAGPIMGLSVASPSASTRGLTSAAEDETPIRIVSCNVQNGLSDLPRLMDEIERLHGNILVFQETSDGEGEIERRLQDWNNVHVGEYWISSRWPVRLISECQTRAFDRETAILCEVQTDSVPVLIASVHMSTARYGLGELRWHSMLTDSGLEEFGQYQLRRAYEMQETRSWLNEAADGHPVLIAGDFNTPTTSSLFARHWADLTSGFEAAGNGYGWTSPCNTHRLWPSNTPWLRIDHLLCSPEWVLQRFQIGRTDGSDHRLIWADLLPPRSPAANNPSD